MSGLWLPLLLGCVTAENYGAKSVNLYCDRLYECNRADFESTFSDMADCRDELMDDTEKTTECLVEECTFDAEAAAECLGNVSSAECEDWLGEASSGDCNDVYTDCDSVDLAVCLMD